MTTGRIIQLGGPRFRESRPKASYIHVRMIVNSKKTNRQYAASQTLLRYLPPPPLADALPTLHSANQSSFVLPSVRMEHENH